MLTTRQRDVLAFIRQYLARQGHAPALDEIARGIGIRSKGVVHRHVQALADAGKIRLLPGRKRGIELVDEKSAEGATLPLLGRIAAGYPIEAIPGQDTLNLADFLLGPGRYALRVAGDSMIEAGILDGDTVVIEQRDAADDGEIVVALIDGEEATLKRLKYRRDGNIALIAANPAIPAMIYAADRVTIQGVVVGQLRSYR